jgi:ATPase subunit of ABC transporter with duplicated ATPase domains
MVEAEPMAKQIARRIALIGHSGAGKSTCLRILGYEMTADMDHGLGTRACPSLKDALKWIAEQESKVIVISNHEVMLNQMRDAKAAKSDLLTGVSFIYLHVPPAELSDYLRKPLESGSARSAAGVNYTINNYSALHTLYDQLADWTINCSGKPGRIIAAEVAALASGSAKVHST